MPPRSTPQNADGSYTFTFPTAAPALPTLADGFPIAPVQSAQTLVGIHAARTFEGVQYPAGASLSSSRPAARSPRARSCPTRRATSVTST